MDHVIITLGITRDMCSVTAELKDPTCRVLCLDTARITLKCEATRAQAGGIITTDNEDIVETMT